MLLKKLLFAGMPVFFGAALLTSFSALGFFGYMQNRIHYGVFVSGVDVGGRTVRQARALLEERIEQFSGSLRLVANGTSVVVPFWSLGATVLLDDALEAAYAPGHSASGGFLARASDAARLQKQPLYIPLQLAFDDARLARHLSREFGKSLEQPVVDATLELHPAGNLILTPSEDGVVIDRAGVREALGRAIAALTPISHELRTVVDAPRITTKDAETFKKRVEMILARAPYFLFGNGKRFSISRDDLTGYLLLKEDDEKLDIMFDAEAIAAWLFRISPAMSREPRNVELAADEKGRVIIEKPSEDALRLNVLKTTAAVISALREAGNIVARNGARSIEAVLNATPAPLNEKLVGNLGITQLLGKGESDFAGSSKSRAQNIRVGAEKYRGVLVGPGEEFSFNAYLGDIDAKNGYVPELVIKNGKLTPEYGGGLCQVSTTMFRAAVYAGLKISQRLPHSIPVRYYAPQGFDATIYPPSPDLKFVNTTTGTMFIQPRIQGTKLVFEFYGSSDERRVEVDGPRVVLRGSDGSMKTVVTQKVYNSSGELMQERSFWSSYKSPALYQAERNPLE